MKYLGNIITKNPITPIGSSAPGVWKLNDVSRYKYNGSWPGNTFLTNNLVTGGAASGTGTSFSCVYPSGIQAGDWLICYGSYGSATSGVTVSGYTVSGNSSGYQWVAVKNATGSESGTNLSVTIPVSTWYSAEVVKLTPLSPCAPSYVALMGTYSADGVVNSPLGFSDPAEDDIQIAFFAINGARTLTTAPNNYPYSITTKTTSPTLFSWYALNRGVSDITAQFSGATNIRVACIKAI